MTVKETFDRCHTVSGSSALGRIRVGILVVQRPALGPGLAEKPVGPLNTMSRDSLDRLRNENVI